MARDGVGGRRMGRGKGEEEERKGIGRRGLQSSQVNERKSQIAI